MADPRPHDGNDTDEVDLLSPTVVLYAAMLGATIAGLIAGVAIDSLIGSRTLGVPLGCAVVFESAAGARLGAARYRALFTPRRAAQVSLTYSAGLLVFSVPLLGWMEASRTGAGEASTWTPGKVASVIGLLAVATLARWGLMVTFSRRPRR